MFESRDLAALPTVRKHGPGQVASDKEVIHIERNNNKMTTSATIVKAVITGAVFDETCLQLSFNIIVKVWAAYAKCVCQYDKL